MEDTDRCSGRFAGCSAMGWRTGDGLRLLGRNFDFNRMAGDTRVTFLPRGMELRLTRDGPARRARYAMAGMGLLAVPGVPLLYDGVNERGLMAAQLYYRGLARYPSAPRPGTEALQPPMAVGYLLSACATVDEAAAALRDRVTLVDRPLLGTVPPLHWCFSDCTGEVMVAEPDDGGLRIHRNTVGVMTNSPSYGWHRMNLLNYAGVRDLDYDALELGEERLEPCFSGSGAQGLPGDWSSPSRFVRLAFLRKYAVPGRGEAQGVARLFRLMESAAFPLGMVRVGQPGSPTELDQGVVPWDYTLYTAVLCAQTGRYCWTTYDNPAVRSLELRPLLSRTEPLQFPLDPEPMAL